MRIHTPHTRDAALRKLDRLSRWLVAGTVVLTGVLSDLAAHAFPGKTRRSTSAKASRSSAGTRPGAPKASGTAGALEAPEQTPQNSTESSAEESTSPQESAPAQESTPSDESAPAQESTTAQAAPPPASERSETVVSGGS